MDNILYKHWYHIKYKGWFFHRNKYNCILKILIFLVVYSCSDTNSCGECQYWTRRGYNCQWCDSYPKCYHFTPDTHTCTDFHTKQNCKPVVKKVKCVSHLNIIMLGYCVGCYIWYWLIHSKYTIHTYLRLFLKSGQSATNFKYK